MKNNRGITLITLVITVIVIAILASVATYSGIEVINSSKLTRFTTEMKLIQTKVNEIYDNKNEYDESIGDSDYKGELSSILGLLDNEWGYGSDVNDYKYYAVTALKDSLGIEDVEQSVFINLEKRKVISSEGITVDGVTYYVLEQLPNSLYNVEYEKPTVEKFGIDFMFGETDENEKLYEGDKLQFKVQLGEEAIKAHSKVTKIYGEETTILSNEDITKSEEHEFIVEKNVTYQVDVTIKDTNNDPINEKILTITMTPYLETEEGIAEKTAIEADLENNIDEITVNTREQIEDLEIERENGIQEIEDEMRICEEERAIRIEEAENNAAKQRDTIDEEYAATLTTVNNNLNAGLITNQQANNMLAEAENLRKNKLTAVEQELDNIIVSTNKEYEATMQQLNKEIEEINKKIDEEITNLEKIRQQKIANLEAIASDSLKELEKYIFVEKRFE